MSESTLRDFIEKGMYIVYNIKIYKPYKHLGLKFNLKNLNVNLKPGEKWNQ